VCSDTFALYSHTWRSASPKSAAHGINPPILFVGMFLVMAWLCIGPLPEVFPCIIPRSCGLRPGPGTVLSQKDDHYNSTQTHR
jgi:hypothetical protein